MGISEISGHLILIMGPTGSGKGSIVSYLRKTFPDLQYSISCTTRKQRPTEENGREYYFLTNAEFDQKIEAQEFVEWADFGGNRYGTLKSELVDRLEKGQVVITEIELQGVLQLEKIINEKNRTLIYIEAGDWDVLKARALARAPISESELQLRYERYLHEVRSKPLAQYVIDNYDGRLDEANREIYKIVSDIILKIKK